MDYFLILLINKIKKVLLNYIAAFYSLEIEFFFSGTFCF